MNWPNSLITVVRYRTSILLYQDRVYAVILDINFFLLTNLPLSFNSLPIAIQAWSLMFLLLKSFILTLYKLVKTFGQITGTGIVNLLFGLD